MKATYQRCLFIGIGALFTLARSEASAQTLTKLYDFPSAATSVITSAGYNPYDTPVLIGNELWFTTQKGGTTGFGTITKYNIDTGVVTTVMNTMNNTVGNTPQSTFTVVGNNLYYTTTRGGTGDRGTIDVYNTVSGQNTVLYNSPALNSGLPYTLPGNVVYMDQGNGTAALYAVEQNGGGASPIAGGIVKLTLSVATQAVTNSALVYTFPGGTTDGKQPWKGMIQVGNKLYFTTATGGPVTTGAPNGSGGLGVLNLANDSVNDALGFFPNTTGSYALGFNNPVYDASRNALYIGTNGTSTQPGGLLKYDLTTNTYTTLYALTGAATTSGPFPDGKYIDGAITLLDNKLFFTTRQGGALGGTTGGGTIDEFDLATNKFTKLFDLDQTTGRNYGGGSWGGFAVEQTKAGYSLFLTPMTGGINGDGTILRLDIVPEPSSPMLLVFSGAVLLLLRRRPAFSRIARS